MAIRNAISISALIWLAIYCSGCMQITGAKRINAWGLEIESNAGFEVSAGAMQYDHALDRKGYSIESRDTKTPDKY